jgi:hypothetical protein
VIGLFLVLEERIGVEGSVIWWIMWERPFLEGELLHVQH